jgi:integrase/recombinase XerD
MNWGERAMVRPKGTGGKAKVLSPAEIKRIEKTQRGEKHELRNLTLMHLGLGSGMRISEMLGLRIRDVSFRGDVLDEVVLEKHSTKSLKSRTVFLADNAIRWLRKWLEKRDAWDEDDWLFPAVRDDMKPLSLQTATWVFTKMFADAGIKGAKTHSLRRTHANTLRRNAVDLKIIQEQLGHSTLAVTEAYLQVDPVEAKRAIKSLRF